MSIINRYRQSQRFFIRAYPQAFAAFRMTKRKEDWRLLIFF